MNAKRDIIRSYDQIIDKMEAARRTLKAAHKAHSGTPNRDGVNETIALLAKGIPAQRAQVAHDRDTYINAPSSTAPLEHHSIAMQQLNSATQFLTNQWTNDIALSRNIYESLSKTLNETAARREFLDTKYPHSLTQKGRRAHETFNGFANLHKSLERDIYNNSKPTQLAEKALLVQRFEHRLACHI